jgi:hypothetical protein
MECLAQLPLAMHGKRPIEFGGEFHAGRRWCRT